MLNKSLSIDLLKDFSFWINFSQIFRVTQKDFEAFLNYIATFLFILVNQAYFNCGRHTVICLPHPLCLPSPSSKPILQFACQDYSGVMSPFCNGHHLSILWLYTFYKLKDAKWKYRATPRSFFFWNRDSRPNMWPLIDTDCSIWIFTTTDIHRYITTPLGTAQSFL